MRDNALRPDAWATAHGGLRGSSLLRSGAVLSVLSVLADAGGRLFLTASTPVSQAVMVGAWLGWIAALALLGAGFVWIGANPVLTRCGLWVGAFHGLHAAFLMVRIFTTIDLAIPIKGLVVGRLLLVAIFALVERGCLGGRSSLVLAGAAYLVLLKAVLPLAELVPEPGLVVDALYNSVPAILLALALLHTCGIVRRHEDTWASTESSRSVASLEGFNNPLNPQQGPPDRSDRGP